MKKLNQLILISFVAVLSVGCFPKEDLDLLEIQKRIDVVEKLYAPDKRVIVFDTQVKRIGDSIIVSGEFNDLLSLDALRDELERSKISYFENITVLPAEELKEKVHGIVRNSVSNMRSNPRHSAELATQVTMGTPLNVLKKEGSWYLVQSPDNYIGWIDGGGMTLFTLSELHKYEEAPKIIFTSAYGHMRDRGGLIISDLVLGDILILKEADDDDYLVGIPDGREGWIKKEEAEEFEIWLKNLRMDQNSLVNTSMSLMGVPYLWGGTSAKGVDCSGFTKTIFFMNGMIIPRDASQQVNSGIPIDEEGDFSKLEEGDLLFFGRHATDSTSERVIHVGMWVGNNEFIHSSGRVRISSVDPISKFYDEYNVNRYLRSKRLLNGVTEVQYLKNREIH